MPHIGGMNNIPWPIIDAAGEGATLPPATRTLQECSRATHSVRFREDGNVEKANAWTGHERLGKCDGLHSGDLIKSYQITIMRTR